MEGSFQEFIPDTVIGKETLPQELEMSEIMKMLILDIAILNRDRHGGNYLVKDSRIHSVDNDYCLSFLGYDFDKILLPPGNTSSTYSKYSALESPIPLPIVDKLKRFASWKEGQNTLRDLLTELIGKGLAEAYVKRILALVGSIDENGIISEAKFLELLPPPPSLEDSL